MRNIYLIPCLLIGILQVQGFPKKTDSMKLNELNEQPTAVSETKDKRQISRDTATFNKRKQDNPEQPQESIYSPKSNPFLIHPLTQREHQLRNFQTAGRSQQLQALGPQLEQSQEIQHYAYLQDISRNQPAKVTPDEKAQIVQNQPSASQEKNDEQYESQFSHVQGDLQVIPGHNQQRPTVYIPQQQIAQQQTQYQSAQEEHLLRLIEDELQARAIQEIQNRAVYLKPNLQNKEQLIQRQAYRPKADESPEYIQYSQPQIPQYSAVAIRQPQNLQHLARPQIQQREPPGHLYRGPGPISYRALPNHPLAESSLENEIEKLLAANKPTEFRRNHPGPVLSTRSPYQQTNAHSTTAAPATTIALPNHNSFKPPAVHFTGFLPSPTVPSLGDDKKYVPTAYTSSKPQYIIESASSFPKAQKQNTPSNQYGTKQHLKSKQNHHKQNLGPVQFYYNEPQQRAQPSQSPTEYQQYQPPTPAPSLSTIFVSQSTGIRSAPKSNAPTNSKHLNLPPPNGKPLSEAEFQALVDAGYPVQAVPVPVPVPYEQYIKQHPEYLESTHRHAQRAASDSLPVSYLRPRHPRQQSQQAVPGMAQSS